MVLLMVTLLVVTLSERHISENGKITTRERCRECLEMGVKSTSNQIEEVRARDAQIWCCMSRDAHIWCNMSRDAHNMVL